MDAVRLFLAPNVFLLGSPWPPGSSVFCAELNAQVNAAPLAPSAGTLEHEVYELVAPTHLRKLPRDEVLNLPKNKT